MEIILKEDVKGLGYKNDIVDVRPGYGRNYLIPKGLATLATESARKVLTENIKQAAHKAAKLKQDALDLVSSLGDLVLEVPAKVSETGKIFGAVTTIQLAESLRAKGFDIDRRKISIIDKEVKMLGEYTLQLDLHKEVKHTLKFRVVSA